MGEGEAAAAGAKEEEEEAAAVGVVEAAVEDSEADEVEGGTTPSNAGDFELTNISVSYAILGFCVGGYALLSIVLSSCYCS